MFSDSFLKQGSPFFHAPQQALHWRGGEMKVGRLHYSLAPAHSIFPHTTRNPTYQATVSVNLDNRSAYGP